MYQRRLGVREICVNEKKAWVQFWSLIKKKDVHKNKPILYDNDLICKAPWAFMISFGVSVWKFLSLRKNN